MAHFRELPEDEGGITCKCSSGMEYSYWYLYSYLLEYYFFSTQLYSVLCENYLYLLKYWRKKSSTHEYFLSTAEYFFVLKQFYSRKIYIKVSKYLECF